MSGDTYQIRRNPSNPKEAIHCIDLVQSEDDGGWYAHEYDFAREDNYTRMSDTVYPTREDLLRALESGTHRWGKWD